MEGLYQSVKVYGDEKYHGISLALDKYQKEVANNIANRPSSILSYTNSIKKTYIN